MEAPAVGAVVVVHFPFSDLTQSKLRPAIVLADVGRGDYLLCQVTSNPYSDHLAIRLTDVDFSRGSLQRTSYARPGKLFTASRSLIAGEAGLLQPEGLRKIIRAVVRVLERGL